MQEDKYILKLWVIGFSFFILMMWAYYSLPEILNQSSQNAGIKESMPVGVFPSVLLY